MSTRSLDIVPLLAGRGGANASGEAVSPLAHALQCAALARRDGAGDEVVLAALLHDVGHLIGGAEDTPRSHHGMWGARLLRSFVPPRVAWLVEHHVVAKRYLCTVDAAYVETLSAVSRRSWLAQGGRLDRAALEELEGAPNLLDVLRIRRWDDLAKDPHAMAPPLEAYRELLESCFGPQSWERPLAVRSPVRGAFPATWSS